MAKKKSLFELVSEDNRELEIILKDMKEFFKSNLAHLEVPGNFDIEDKHRLTRLFLYALNNDRIVLNEGRGKYLFPEQNIPQTLNTDEKIEHYISTWCSKYIKDKYTSKIGKPLKNFGERDDALIQKVATSTKDKEVLKNYIKGHYIFMSAENNNGGILEEYLATVLEPYGWIWCAGTTYKACDFVYMNQIKKRTTLLQIKNKYNTENSSSVTIRNNTSIKKWYRLARPKVAFMGKYIPIPNWEELNKIVSEAMEKVADIDMNKLKDDLTEKKYLSFIDKESINNLESDYEFWDALEKHINEL